MKEAVTKFDLESAFKALDEIEIPKTGKVRANRPALSEIFSRKTKFDSLMEEYYDVSSQSELEDAQEAREAEVAKAKLERIEKIVDLDAESPEDLLTSYVGKNIIQCPQCMTLFYKDPEDIVKSEEDPSVVNVNEICQHCGNEAGYTLVGKVGEAEPGEFEEPATEEIPTEEPVDEEPVEDTAEEDNLEDLGDLGELDLNLEDDEETKEESFNAHSGEALVEELSDDKDLDDKLEANDEYIEYLRNAIADEKDKLEKETNEQIKAILQRNIDALNADLEAAVPDAVKNGSAVAEEPTEEPIDDIADELVDDMADEHIDGADIQEESCSTSAEGSSLTESLHEDADIDVSADEFEELINSPEFKKPISDSAVRAMLNSEKEDEEDSIDESANEQLTEAAITRSGKCDWVLKNAVDKNGQQKYGKFIICCFEPTYSSKKNKKKAEPISKPIEDPVAAYKNGYLAVSKEYGRPEAKDKYKDAENIAKGRSMQRDCGPVFIFMAKSEKLDQASFLCQYFNGALHAESDQLESYIKDINGNKKAAKGGSDQADFTKTAANKLEAGSKVKLNNDEIANVVSIEQSGLDNNTYMVQLKLGDGSVKPYSVSATYVFNVVRDAAANESLNTIMADVEELNESSLEALVSDSLVESYGNVAGFKLTECSQADNKFTVNGTIFFTSGNTRKTSYVFSESYNSEDGKIGLVGLNEKLGLDKQFTLTGRIENKTLITESFKRNK